MIPDEIRRTLDWLIDIEDFAAARALAFAVYRRLPVNHPESCDFLAGVLFKTKHYGEAVEYARRTVDLLPGSVAAHFNLGKALQRIGRVAESERHFDFVCEREPDWIDPRIDRAVSVAFQGRCDEAEASLKALLTKVPGDDRAAQVIRFNLGWHHMRAGRFKESLEGLAIGRRLKIWGGRAFETTQPCLSPGVSLKGKTVLMIGEGGYGDEIINVRFAQTIKRRGGRAIFLTRPELVPLLSRARDLEAAVTKDDVPAFDFWAPAMDVPHLLGLDLDELPREPYLSVDKKSQEKWRARMLQEGAGLKIGVRWQGNSLYEQDLMRGVPFAMMESLCAIPGVKVFSFQRDDGSEERPSSSPVIDLGPELKTWDDTAAALGEMDLLVSSCTSVPHLAGALGKKVFLYCPLSSYYVWALPADRSPWYRDVTLFRQTQAGSWQEPFENVSAAVREWATQPSLRIPNPQLAPIET